MQFTSAFELDAHNSGCKAQPKCAVSLPGVVVFDFLSGAAAPPRAIFLTGTALNQTPRAKLKLGGLQNHWQRGLRRPDTQGSV